MDEQQKEQMTQDSAADTRDLLEKLVKNSRKQMRYARVAALFTMAMFAALVVTLVLVVPPALQTMEDTRKMISNAVDSLEDIDQMSASITRTSEDISTLVGQNSTQLTEAVTQISQIDFEGINQSIRDLQDAIEPLATAMRNLAAIFGG